MTKVWEITAESISRWADRIEAASDLPKLVRRLLAATASSALIEMPGGSSTRLGGWDGVVQARDDNAFCPQGASGWELSVDQKIKSKLDKDFDKRARSPPSSLDPKRMTYVAVVARKFAGKQAWLQEKRSLRKFADVRLYDAEDLVQWLERAPAVERWFATILGFPTDQSLDAEKFLESWSRRTTPPLPWEIVLAGAERKQQAEEIERWLAAWPSKPLYVRSGTREEALLFFVASLAKSSNPDRWLSRTIIVESIEAFRRAIVTQRAEPLVVVPAFGGVDLGEASTGNAYVVLPLDGDELPRPEQALALGPQPYKDLQKVLATTSRSEEEAQRLVYDAGGQLAALQRLCGHIDLPEWAQGSPRAELFALLLAGAWTPNNASDQDVIRLLGGVPESALALCQALEKRGATKPIRELWTQEAWQWQSPRDAWRLLSHGLTESHLAAFRQVIFSVLGGFDPAYETPKEDRLTAAVQDRSPHHSAALREGIAISMVMLVQSSEFLEDPSRSERRRHLVNEIVLYLLSDKRGWQSWATLSALLPTMAEAAPESFMSAVEESLDRGDMGVAHLLAEEGRMGSAPHTGLLWSLEVLGWSPNSRLRHRVALALARLTERDRDAHLPGKMMNRPINSLGALLSFILPQSSTTVEERVRIFNYIFDNHPEVGWQLAFRWLGEGTGMGLRMSAYRPRHLQWPLPKEGARNSSDESSQFVAIVEIALRRIDDANRWATILELARRLPESFDIKILDALATAQGKISDPKHIVWAALRERIGLEHRASNPRKRSIEQLRSLYAAFAPADPIQKIRWLFSEYSPTLPDSAEGGSDFRKAESKLQKLRQDSLLELWHQPAPWQSLAALITSLEYPGLLGFSLGEAPFALEIERRLFEHETEPVYSPIVEGFARARFRKEGIKWAEQTIRSLTKSKRLFDAATIALAADNGKPLWDAIDAIDVEVSKLYWQRLPMLAGECTAEDTEYAIRRLIKVGREQVALNAVANSQGPISASVAIELLEKLRLRLRAIDNNNNATELAKTIREYHIARVFDAIDNDPSVDTNQVIALEITFLPWLKESTRSARHLWRALGENPEWFAELIGLMYRRPDEGPAPETITEESRRAAEAATEFVWAWEGWPGQDLPDDEREAVLEAWSTAVLRKTSEDGRARSGSMHVAEVLARAPNGTDGAWPCVAARKIIERGAHPNFNHQLAIAKRNLRGMTERSLDEGGTQERELAAEYRALAEKLQDNFPRTAAMLDEISRHYEHEAIEHDPQAERYRLEHSGGGAPMPSVATTSSLSGVGGPLTHLKFTGLSLAPSIELDFATRLNVLTGDNSLGKTLVLEVAWWALTGTWTQQPVTPPVHRGKSRRRAIPGATLAAKAGERRMTASYEAAQERWVGGRPLAHSLVIYARVDGSISLWDPIRNVTSVKSGELDVSTGYHLTQFDLWNGLIDAATRAPLCDGFINDAVRWRSEVV